MNNCIKLVAIAAITCSQSICALTNEEVISFVDGVQMSESQYAPSSVGLGGSSTAFTVLNYDSELVEGLFELIKSDEHSEYWKQVFIRLRIIATADPDSVGLERVVNKAIMIENLENMNPEDKLSVLSSAYGAVARFQNDKALAFLKQRTDPAFWENRELESKVFYDHAPHLNTTHNGITEAIMAIAEMGNNQAEELLLLLSKHDQYVDMPNVLRSLKAAKYYHESAELLIAGIETAYSKRLELIGEKAAAQVTEEPSDKIPLAPKAEKVAQESIALEPVIEGPTQIVTPEFSDELEGQSSQWWLWLIGAVVVSGFALVVRHKS